MKNPDITNLFIITILIIVILFSIVLFIFNTIEGMKNYTNYNNLSFINI